MITLEQRQTVFAETYRLTFDEYKKLVTSLNMDEVTTCLYLIKTKVHTSMFRKGCALKVREWLAGRSLMIDKPLTELEFKWAKPKWPVNLHLPT